MHDDGTEEMEFPTPLCPLTEPHPKHRIPDAWRDECPGIPAQEERDWHTAWDGKGNAIGSGAGRETRHVTGLGIRPCEAHQSTGCEWCHPTTNTPAVRQAPSTEALLAGDAIKSAWRYGLLDTFLEADLLARLCQLNFLREDQDGDVFVDYEGCNWLYAGADLTALDQALDRTR